MLLSKTLLLLAATSIQARRLVPRALFPTHMISGLHETLPNDNNGLLYKTYQPYLDIANGCVPYPAVDAEGNTK